MGFGKWYIVISILIEEMFIIKSEKKDIIEKRRESFLDKYEELFGFRPELKELSDDDNSNVIIVYNVYGIKSKWI